jgi:diadenylate cyclase
MPPQAAKGRHTVPLRDDRLRAVLQKVAPGTALREGIDRIMYAGKGAIIVLGCSGGVQGMLSGGFKLDTRFTAQRLSEVAKMDGAIVVDEHVEHILYANVHLVPDPTVPTSETGTRHRTAERVARQTGTPVISVSESMRTVSLYLDGSKHVLQDIRMVLYRANQALSTLERYRNRLDQVSAALSALELENFVTLRDVFSVLQRAEMVGRIAEEIEAFVAELGTDGRLLQLQLDELLLGVDRERRLVVRDYERGQAPNEVLAALSALPPEALLRLDNLARALGYSTVDDGIDEPVQPRGYRLLSRIPRLPASTIHKLVDRFGSVEGVMTATLQELDEVEGIGATRAQSIKEGLLRLAESTANERYA